MYHNNNESAQAGSSGLGAGDQETDDAGRLFSKFQAATYLYGMTGESKYKEFVEANYTAVVSGDGPTCWDMEREEVLLYYTIPFKVQKSSLIIYRDSI
jgi:endoglucanase